MESLIHLVDQCCGSRNKSELPERVGHPHDGRPPPYMPLPPEMAIAEEQGFGPPGTMYGGTGMYASAPRGRDFPNPQMGLPGGNPSNRLLRTNSGSSMASVPQWGVLAESGVVGVPRSDATAFGEPGPMQGFGRQDSRSGRSVPRSNSHRSERSNWSELSTGFEMGPAHVHPTNAARWKGELIGGVPAPQQVRPRWTPGMMFFGDAQPVGLPNGHPAWWGGAGRGMPPPWAMPAVPEGYAPPMAEAPMPPGAPGGRRSVRFDVPDNAPGYDGYGGRELGPDESPGVMWNLLPEAAPRNMRGGRPMRIPQNMYAPNRRRG